MRDAVRVVIVDNYDSFTWNLVDEFSRLGSAVEVVTNDTGAGNVIESVAAGRPGLLVISPGPGSPGDAGCSLEVAIRAESARLPMFGVCLGLQVMVEALGGRVLRSSAPVHGKASRISHDGGPPFESLPSPMLAGRYHSLSAVSLPDSIQVAARTDGMVMAVRHLSAPMIGVQFHPESILTPEGSRIISNTLEWARRVSC